MFSSKYQENDIKPKGEETIRSNGQNLLYFEQLMLEERRVDSENIVIGD